MRRPVRFPEPASPLPAAPAPPSEPEVLTSTYGGDLPDMGVVCPPGMVPAPPPKNITHQNIEEWVNPPAHARFVPAPQSSAPPEEDQEPAAASAIRIARRVLRDESSSRDAKKVARMLISVLSMKVPDSLAREG